MKILVDMPDGWVNGKDCVLLCPLLHMNCATKNCPLANAKKAVQIYSTSQEFNPLSISDPDGFYAEIDVSEEAEDQLDGKRIKLWATEEE